MSSHSQKRMTGSKRSMSLTFFGHRSIPGFGLGICFIYPVEYFLDGVCGADYIPVPLAHDVFNCFWAHGLSFSFPLLSLGEHRSSRL